MSHDWVLCSVNPPPKGVEIMTKIKDEHGERMEQSLVFEENLWWYPDRSMYIYYAPTHWKPLADPHPTNR